MKRYDLSGSVGMEEMQEHVNGEYVRFEDVPRIINCKDCVFWTGDEWDGSRSCHNDSGRFFVGGGDCNDGLYTQPDFGCIDGTNKNP